MNVKDLRIILEDQPDDRPIVMSKDGEGNGFSPLYDASPEMYLAESTWSGELIHPDDAEDYPDAVDALTLWPVN
ncbi:hypothetical protein JRC04_05405 [Mycolicibacterium sp. S2-37]|uniref:hypothetical protein n=1 Tax=Mycolicibacterium sp. S2-37 TaxID=2810297 RepID=UPI001A945A16|nr:hypothetical protein [Mycolicibacterium sp. S2-37]MBO0676892.1 hypothetical protein [Mycolicibacterium sp. S2-37]